MNLYEEFKEFAIRGNVVDMGIGVLLGTAFGSIIDSLVTDIMLPPIGLLMGNVDISNLYLNLSDQHFNSLQEAKEAGAVTINYGEFADNILHFTIIAFASFLSIKQVNKLRNLPPDSNVKKSCPFCLTDIPIRATRCPQCTSLLNEEEDVYATEPNASPKINIKAS